MNELQQGIVAGLTAGLLLGWLYGMAVGYIGGRWCRRAMDRLDAWTMRAAPSRVALGGLVLVTLLLSLGCGTLKGQVQLGSDVSHPNARVLESHVCRGDDSAARLYLALPEYAWLGAGALERYFTDAKDLEFQGRCPCAGKGCPNGGK